jgi:hypothetical protein
VAHLFGLRAPYPIAGVLRGIALLAAAPVLIRAMRDQVARRRTHQLVPAASKT